MADPPIKLIATDIDGTMLRSDGNLAAEVKEALHRAHEVGIHVVPTTGRPKMVTADVIAALEMDHYWIFANGAVTWHLGRNETIRGHWIDVEVAQSMARWLQAELPNVGLAVEFANSVAYQSGFEAIVGNISGVNPVTDIAEAIQEPVQKILVFDQTIEIDDLMAQVAGIVGEVAVPTFSGLPFIELAADTVTKGMAIADLAADLEITQDEVASFGDNQNDISMLEWAGRSYAMGNASEDAIAAADYVIGTNDMHGLAVQVHELVDEFLDQ